MLHGAQAPNKRRIAIHVLSQTASFSSCERNWSTFNLINSKRINRLGHLKLQNLVSVYYNIRLKHKHAKKEQNLKEYTNPINLIDIFCKEGEEDPLYDWVKEIREPILD